MMYVIYNSDGSIFKKSITEYIQQGNSYANVLFVSVKDVNLDGYTCAAVITLPNGQNIGGIIEPSSEPETIDGTEYDGYYITLDETATLMAGAIRISVSTTIEDVRTVTYPIYLNVNSTPFDADAPLMMSYNQYLQLTALIESQTYVYNSKITISFNGTEAGYFNLNQSSAKTIDITYTPEGFVTTNTDQDIEANKTFKNKALSFYTSGTGQTATYRIKAENGVLKIGDLLFDGTDLYPTTDSTMSLGKNNLYYSNVYADTVKTSSIKLETTTNHSSYWEIHNVGGVLLLRDYTFSVASGNETFKYAGLNNANLGDSTNRWKTLWLSNGIKMAVTTTGVSPTTYNYNFELDTTSGALKLNGNTFVDIYGYVHSSKFVSDSWYFGQKGTGADANLFNIGFYWFDKTNGSAAFYHWSGTHSGQTEGEADLGTSTDKWKDLYLSGNANIGGKINDLTLPTGMHTLATLDDIAMSVYLDTTETISSAKTWLNGSGGSRKCYLFSGSGLTDITTAVKNGDYDNYTIGNSNFNSTAHYVNVTASGYYILRSRHNATKMYIVAGENLKALVPYTLYIIDENVPSRFEVEENKWYKL